MNKLFILLPILSLLTVGVFCQHSNEEDAPATTIYEWLSCGPYQTCIMIDYDNFFKCVRAYHATIHLMQYGSKYQPCIKFWDYYSDAVK